MFKKLKQRIEDGDPQQQSSPNVVLSSTPKKKSSRPSSTRSYVNGESNLKRENKWEKRRNSSASLYSSRDSLLSIDSTATATISRISYGGSSCSAAGTPVESTLILGAVIFIIIISLFFTIPN